MARNYKHIYTKPAKTRLSDTERDKRVLDWYNETDNAKWNEKQDTLIAAWSRPTVDRWMSNMIEQKVIMDTYGAAKKARKSPETPIVIRICEIYAETDTKARWKLIWLLLDKKYPKKKRTRCLTGAGCTWTRSSNSSRMTVERAFPPCQDWLD